MKAIYLIAINTMRELLRNRILYSILLFSIFLIGLMGALGQLSHTETMRLTMGLGLSSIHISLVLLTLFVGGTLVYREIEKLTILTLLSRSIDRTQFLIGKYLGLLAVILCIITALFLVFYMNVIIFGFDIPMEKISVVFLGFFLEMMLLLSVTIFFSTFCASFLTITFAIAFFVIGHWIHNLDYLLQNTPSKVFSYFAAVMRTTYPNLEVFNWRSHPLDVSISSDQILWATILAIFWVFFFMSAASFLFRRRDFA